MLFAQTGRQPAGAKQRRFGKGSIGSRVAKFNSNRAVVRIAASKITAGICRIGFGAHMPGSLIYRDAFNHLSI